MRFLKMFLLNAQGVLEQRGRTFVWFLYPVITTAIFLLFWLGALKGSGGKISGWTFSTITSYYFLLLITSSMLTSHIEENVSEDDIQQGYMTHYLIKPYSYLTLKFLLEIPWRLLQGFYAIIVVVVFIALFGKFFTLSSNIYVIGLSIFIALLAFAMSFLYKMILGLSAFWFTDARGFFQAMEAIMLIFGGFIVPITLLPNFMEKVSSLLPFSYMAYYPIIAAQGKLSADQLAKIILIQIVWCICLFGIYKIVWAQGRRKYTAIGQ